MPSIPVLIAPLPGVGRDGSTLNNTNCIDAQWVRWQRGLPRKIRGYKQIQATSGQGRGSHMYTRNGYAYLAIGSSGLVEQINTDTTGSVFAPVLRTPNALVNSANNLWQFDMITDPTTLNNDAMLVGHAGQNLSFIDSNVESAIFWGKATSSTALTPLGLPVLNTSIPIATITASTNTSITLTAVSDTTALSYGMTVSGTGIPINTYVKSWTVNTITMSNAATATSVGIPVSVVTGGVSGGVLCMPPYIVAFGSNGLVYWNAPANSTSASGADFWQAINSGQAYVSDQKIVKGMLVRGGAGTSPSALLWTLNSLILMQYNSSTTWQFNTLTDASTIMSSNAICEYNGMYFWLGTDRFFVYNGTVRELPNVSNTNWLFDNINLAQRQKVFAFKNTRWGEIWWCYPRGSATECSHAVIYNVRENCWYDTALPSTFRTCSTNTGVYPYPVMCDATVNGSTYPVWQHESGLDAVSSSGIGPIDAWFETNSMSSLLAQKPNSHHLAISAIEPDFIQSGDMTLKITGNANARANIIFSETVTIKDPLTITDPKDQMVYLKTKRRQMRFRFESNVIGGDFQMGNCYAHIEADSEETVLG